MTEKAQEATISVIIPTFNRYPFIVDTVNHIIPLLQDCDELIIVDQSDPGISAIIKAELPIKDSIIYKLIGPPSLPNARNVGIEIARKDIILFLDDDINPDKSILEEHRKMYKIENVGGVAGAVVEEDSPFTNTKAAGGGMTCYGRVYRNFTGNKIMQVRSFLGANMSFSKKASEKIGCFDCDYTGNATLEETDYAYRLRSAGFRIMFNPNARLIHLIAKNGGCRELISEKREYSNIRNATRFYLKNMNKVLFPLFFAYTILLSVKRLKSTLGVVKSLKLGIEAIHEGINSLKKATT